MNKFNAMMAGFFTFIVVTIILSDITGKEFSEAASTVLYVFVAAMCGMMAFGDDDD